jgi:phosphopantothenate---cysteine ligase (CTP)
MEKSEIIEKIDSYKKIGFDPKLPSGPSSIGTGGFNCPLCKENKNWCHQISNEKNQTIQVCEDCFRLFFPPYKVKKILITSGGTREYIDGVRVLTNISSGKLGSLIARQFDDCNNDLSRKRINPVPLFDIYFIYAKGSEKPITWDNKYMHYYEVTDVQSVFEVMEKLVPEMDVVIHPMAVSDFGFTPVKTKLKSNDPIAFVESLKKRIFQTPKILSHIKKWNPNCFLVSFKFEDGFTKKELLEMAYDSGYKNGSDLVIANDKDEMVRNKTHISYFCTQPEKHFSSFNDLKPYVTKIVGKEEIAKEIFKIVNNK